MQEVVLSPNSLKVLKARYLKCDANNVPVETPEEMFRRVAKNIALANTKYGEDPEPYEEDFYHSMANLFFLPNSPTLMNAGNELQQLSACFVLPIEDSMEGIFEAVKHAALIQKSGGGTGFSFSSLRPKNDIVKTTGGIASGPISFMKVFDSATDTIKQGGKRRGANMGILKVDHPDILEFISAKEKQDHLNNFNISVMVTDEFMEAVKEDVAYNLYNPRSGEVSGQLRAREVFHKIVEMAHKNGEPGILFYDAINRDNPLPALSSLEATNPCSEQPLLPYEACNLGSINLSKMVHLGAIDYKRLEETTRIALRFLDNVIDMNKYPLERIQEMARGNRKVGLGVMGWSDLLILLQIPYNSQKAVDLAEKVMAFIQEISHDESHQLALRRGSFPNREKSIYQQEMRNATTTTIAPTGSISIIANCSSGIEPLFAINYERHVIDDILIETHPIFERMAKEEGFYSENLMREVAKSSSIQGIEVIPPWIRKIFVTSHDIAPEWHIKMQAAFQRHIDNATSKTVNFPYEATKEEVAEVYLKAYELGCKGATVYRDGSRSEQVLNVSTKEKEKGETRKKRPRPDVTWGTTEKTNIGCGRLYITVNSDEGGICEVFTSTGRGGGCRSQSEATSRLISLALRSRIPIEEITHQLRGIRCAAAIKRKGVDNVSCPDAIARAIEKYLRHGQEMKEQLKMFYEEEEPDYFHNNHEGSQACPDCGYELEHNGGCVFCRNCGFTKCW